MGLFDFFKRKSKAEQKDLETQKQENTPTKNIQHLISIKTEIIPDLNRKQEDCERVQRDLDAFHKGDKGLTPGEILLLSYAHKYKTEGNSFPAFWWYEYHIRNVQSVLQSLVEKGFLTLAPIEGSIKNLTIEQIRVILRKYNLPLSGKKDDLVKRLCSELPKDLLSAEVPVQYYALTNLGKKELEENEYIPYLHKNKQLNVGTSFVSNFLSKHPEMSWRDGIWAALNHQTKECASQLHLGNAGPIINLCNTKFQFLMEEGKRDMAFFCLAESLFYDINLYSPYLFRIENREKKYKTILNLKEKAVDIRFFKKCFGWSSDELWSNLKEVFSKVSAEFSLFSIEETVGLIVSEVSRDTATASALYEKAELRLRT